MLIGAVACGCGLALPGVAAAVPPLISSVTVQNRHPIVVFSAPKADQVSVSIATKPDRATDGSFLSENVAGGALLTDSEIQAGRWLGPDQLDPGTYWLMLRAFPDFDLCYIVDTATYDPSCAQGYSDPVQLVVPKPPTRYAASVQVFRFSKRAYLILRAAPLGEKRAYRLCYRNAAKALRCLRGTLDGFSWNSGISDQLSVTTRGLAKFTTFQWFVGSTKVAQKLVRVA
jgi:hypothetical protein